MAPVFSILFGLVILQSIQGRELRPELGVESILEAYESNESQDDLTALQDILLMKVVDLVLVRPALTQLEHLGTSSYIEECIKFIQTLKTIPKVAKDVGAAVADAAKAGAAEVKKLFKCRTLECIRDMEFEIKNFVNSLPDRFQPSIKEAKDLVLTAKAELEQCLGINNSSILLKKYTL